MDGKPFLTRLVIENYRSIRFVDLRLGPLMFLVGRNGAGKSNILDALRFLAEALREPVGAVLRRRGGLQRVLHEGNDGVSSLAFGLRLEFILPNGVPGSYAVRIRPSKTDRSVPVVEYESCRLDAPAGAQTFEASAVRDYMLGVLASGTRGSAPPEQSSRGTDWLYLPSAASQEGFRALYDALVQLQLYDPSPAVMRSRQPASGLPVLLGDGSNLADVLAAWPDDYFKQAVREYARHILPELVALRIEESRGGDRELIVEMADERQGAVGRPPSQLSDGTLRGIAILAALFQPDGPVASPVLVALEEPETALHPAALGALRDALIEASARRQILVSTHSPDLLDDKEVSIESIIAVEYREGQTVAGPIAAREASLLQDRLCTAGELLRQGYLRPAPKPAGVPAEQALGVS